MRHTKKPRDEIITRAINNAKLLSINYLLKGLHMNNRDWFEIWRTFGLWVKKLAKAGNPPSWRKQQRMIHKLVTSRVGHREETPGPKRPRGRPRKNPLPVEKAFTAGMHPENREEKTPANTEGSTTNPN